MQINLYDNYNKKRGELIKVQLLLTRDFSISTSKEELPHGESVCDDVG